MNWQTYRNLGSISFQDTLQDGSGIRNARKFLNRTAIAFARECVSYYDIVGEFPFVYRERQLHSALVPAIVKTADAILMEQPVSRKFKNISSHGWLDYWVAYHSSVFLIELKHSWYSIKSEQIRGKTQEKWEEALGQLRTIPQTDVDYLSFAAKSKAKIALMVVPFFQSSKSEGILPRYEREEIEEPYHQFLSAITPTPNWSSVWYLHERLQESFEYEEQRYEIYPCVGMVAMVKS